MWIKFNPTHIFQTEARDVPYDNVHAKRNARSQALLPRLYFPSRVNNDDLSQVWFG